MLGDLIIPADSSSNSLGIGLSITVKAGVELLRWLWGAIAQWPWVRSPAATLGFFTSGWLSYQCRLDEESVVL